MRLLLLGVNHRTAAVDVRERLALPADELEAIYAQLRQQYPGAEYVVLSTCNRTEIYVARPSHQPPTADELRLFLAERAGLAISEVAPVTIHREQDQVLQHLFRVCCGLDSMVLGEPQILGQVKRAYEQAVAANAVGPVMHRVFQKAVASAKHVRTHTGISAGRMSIGSVAVDFAKQIFSDFSDKTVLGIGAGEMAKATLRHLMGVSPDKLWLVNRTPKRAQELADTLRLTGDRGGARAWDDLDELLVQADVVITSTGARQPILTAERLTPLTKRRKRRPLFIVDIAVPRDVEPAVGTLTNVYLYNIDDLSSVISGNAEQRRDEVVRCESHLTEAVAACMRQIQHRDIGQLIRHLRHRLHDIGQLEQQRTSRKLAGISAAETQVLEELVAEHTHRVINKILHLPLSQLDHRKAGEVEAPLGFYAAALRRLFDLDEDAVASEADQGETHASASAQKPDLK